MSDQAQISGQGEALTGDQQIIFVKRTGSTNFNTKTSENATSAPKYINTIWFENAETSIAEGKTEDISEKDFWMSGSNTITILQGATLTLGTVAITGTANFRGEGTVELTKDIYVNGGTTKNGLLTAKLPSGATTVKTTSSIPKVLCGAPTSRLITLPSTTLVRGL